MKRLGVFLVIGLLFSAVGCASWFTGRVDQKDARILVLEEERKAATTDEERARIDASIVEEKEGRDEAMEGALEEQKNRQALLAGLISLGIGGLRFAGVAVTKGAIGI